MSTASAIFSPSLESVVIRVALVPSVSTVSEAHASSPSAHVLADPLELRALRGESVSTTDVSRSTIQLATVEALGVLALMPLSAPVVFALRSHPLTRIVVPRAHHAPEAHFASMELVSHLWAQMSTVVQGTLLVTKARLVLEVHVFQGLLLVVTAALAMMHHHASLVPLVLLACVFQKLERTARASQRYLHQQVFQQTTLNPASQSPVPQAQVRMSETSGYREYPRPSYLLFPSPLLRLKSVAL